MRDVEVLVALGIAVGMVGVLVPVLPGSLLVLVSIAVWALALHTPTAWVVLVVAGLCLAVGSVVRYAVPGKRLKTAGVPGRTLALAGILGVVGFFVVPVVGLALGFVLGIYLGELHRLHDARQAWRSTVHALKAVGLGIVIELAACVVATGVWIVGVVVT